MNGKQKKQAERFDDTTEDGRVLLRAYGGACFVLLIGFLVSFLLFQFVLKRNLSEMESEFRYNADMEILTLHYKVQNLEQFWQNVSSFYRSSEYVDRKEFQSFVAPALSQEEHLFFAVIPVQEGRAVFADGVYEAGREGTGLFLDYIKNTPEVRALIQTVVSSRAFSFIPAPVGYVQEEGGATKQDGFFAFPVFSKTGEKKNEPVLAGVFIDAIDGAFFFSQVFRKKENVNIDVFSVEKGSEEKILLFRHAGDVASGVYMGRLMKESYDRLVTRRWLPLEMKDMEVIIKPTPAYIVENLRQTHWLVLFFSLVLTGFTVFLLYIQAGKNIAVGRIVHEKTRALGDSERRVRSIISHALDAIVVIDEAGKITEWNAQAEKIFGWRYDEVIGKAMVDIIVPSRYRQRHHMGMERFLSDGTSNILNKRIEIEALRNDDTTFPVELSVTDHKIHGKQHFTAFVRDIEERQKAERQLLEYTEELKRSNQELDDFVYVVSHDLKEPLRGLYSYSQFLQEDYQDKLDEEGQEKLNTLKELSHRMEELIDTLLYYSRLGRSDLAFKNTDLNKVLQKNIELLVTVAEEKNAIIKVEGKLPTILCDKARVGEIFRNLIVNGIKYNDNEDKQIEVGCITNHKDYQGHNVFYVADNGIGIEERHRDTVFKMFKRLHGRDAYGGGTGSGLAFVKKIVDRHGGQIWVESNKGKGSIFYFTLEG